MAPVSASSTEAHDAALLRRVVQQDRRAFEELYNSYHRRLSRFLMRLAPRFDFAEEIINDTFWVVWCKAAEFRGASRVSTWIMGIAYRRALRALRSERHHAAALRDPLPDEAGGIDHGEEGVTQDWIAQALATLPAEQRLALELAYFMGHSCEEIAAITEAPVGTVKARMFHAREKLREALPALGGERQGAS
jgi:RNA polymerase sigma-70 factor, ECF subfamily